MNTQKTQDTHAPYLHVKFRWWTKADLIKTVDEFKKKYNVTMRHFPKDDMELSLYNDDREEIKITADTLSALISNFRAVLYQKKSAKFTPKDEALRKEITKIYTHDRSTPFPWSFTPEPKFEVEK
jgi:hypothetical protein